MQSCLHIEDEMEKCRESVSKGVGRLYQIIMVEMLHTCGVLRTPYMRP